MKKVKCLFILLACLVAPAFLSCDNGTNYSGGGGGHLAGLNGTWVQIDSNGEYAWIFNNGNFDLRQGGHVNTRGTYTVNGNTLILRITHFHGRDGFEVWDPTGNRDIEIPLESRWYTADELRTVGESYLSGRGIHESVIHNFIWSVVDPYTAIFALSRDILSMTFPDEETDIFVRSGATGAPVVTGVTVNPASTNVEKGGSQSFTAQVLGHNNPPQDVTWSIIQTNRHTLTQISTTGILTVAAEETLTTITVRATSTLNNAISGTAAVSVGGQASTLNGTWVEAGESTMWIFNDGSFEIHDPSPLWRGSYTTSGNNLVITLTHFHGSFGWDVYYQPTDTWYSIPLSSQWFTKTQLISAVEAHLQGLGKPSSVINAAISGIETEFSPHSMTFVLSGNHLWITYLGSTLPFMRIN